MSTSCLRLIALTAVALMPSTPATCDPSAVVPIAVHDGGAVVVPVVLEGAGTVRFLLDTGSARTSVTENLASRLGAPAVARSQMVTTAGNEWRPIVRLGRLSVGDASADGLLALTLPSRAVEAIGMRVEGILGQDFLARFNYTLDYRHRRLVWDQQTTTAGKGETRLGLFTVEGRFLVELPQADGQSIRFVPDSGSDGIVVFERPGMPMLPLDSVGGAAEIHSVSGRRGVQRMRLRRLKVGEAMLKDRPAVMVARLDDNAAEGDGLLPLHIFASVSFNSRDGYLVVRER